MSKVVDDVEPLGASWLIVGPTKRRALLSRMACGEFSITDAETLASGWLSARLAAAWYGDEVLEMEPGESKKVWGVLGVEKEM